MNRNELVQIVHASESDTQTANAFRVALGLPKKKPGVRKPHRRSQAKRSGHDKTKYYERLMHNKYGAGDRFGK